MNSLSEQQQEYLNRPDVRTMPLSQVESKEAQEFDADREAGKIPRRAPIDSPKR